MNKPRRRNAMQGKRQIQRRLTLLEKKMERQAEDAHVVGYQRIFCWDRNCVERAVLRSVLGYDEKPFNAADIMAGW